ncbi:hypothetical protein B0H11DRAFT_2234604 [Mycena galericulata]|nr:hypothetical protein B0H11DRAFT_2234604 [Mycena galericulata]
MTQTPPAAGTGSVPAAALPQSTDNVVALQYLSAAMASLSQASPAPAPSTTVAAPAPAAPVVAAPAPAGFLTQGPWVAGGLYVVVPSSSLLPIAEAPPANEDDAPTWYCITKGRYVGVTLSNSLAVASIVNISGGTMKGYKTQALALQAFNDLLQYRMVSVVS